MAETNAMKVMAPDRLILFVHGIRSTVCAKSFLRGHYPF